jgi:hypothetical protein
VYPNTKLTGCLFHFGQCVWRRLQSLGLSTAYSTDNIFRYAIRLFLNLAFVEPYNICTEYKKIEKWLILNEDIKKKLNEFQNYFQNTFLKFLESNIEISNSRYGPEFWSVAENIKNFIPRTTCCVEAWNRSFNHAVFNAHPNIGRFVEEIQKCSESVRVLLLQTARGRDIKCNRKYEKEFFW